MDIIELIGCNHNELRTKWKRKPKKKKKLFHTIMK